MKNVILSLAVLLSVNTAIAQKKKVAVVTFYSDKIIGYDDIVGKNTEVLANAVLDLKNDPNFNLEPILNKFHDKFFNDYAPKFPFELLEESEVLTNEAYINYSQSKLETYQESLDDYEIYPGYHYIIESLGKTDGEKEMSKMFKDKVDGTMYVRLHFDIVKDIGIGGTATIKMKVYARIALVGKDAKQVFAINESAKSKKTAVMVGGVPVLKPEKILPMCESAVEKLMKDLDKRLNKIVKKSAKKL